MNRGVWIVLVLLAVIGTSLLLWLRRDTEEVAPPRPVTSDYILEDYSLVVLDEDGRENFRAQGPQLQREPGGKALELTLPVFSFPDKKLEGRWTASSARAWVSPKGDEVRLIEDVLLRSPPNERKQITEFKTANLKVFPKDDRAETDDAVSFTRPGVALTGVGFRADMDAKRFSLLSNVKGRYEPSLR